jgi:hypothetical protein
MLARITYSTSYLFLSMSLIRKKEKKGKQTPLENKADEDTTCCIIRRLTIVPKFFCSDIVN